MAFNSVEKCPRILRHPQFKLAHPCDLRAAIVA